MENIRLPSWVSQALAREPSFRVLTMDGMAWIDPFTGKVIPAPWGHDEVAREHLLKTQSWETAKPKPLGELLYIRWHHYLRSNLEFFEALRIFKQGYWLNPFTGEWVPGITLERNEISLHTIEDMARVLAQCPAAQSGKLLEKYRIDILVANGPPNMTTQNLVPAAKSTTAAAKSTTVAAKSTTIAAKSTTSRRSTRKTDFHLVKNMFVKMLTRPPRVDGYQLVVQYEPHSVIPRNFYDFIMLDRQRLFVAIGDLAGDGPGAALMAASTLRTLRQLCEQRGDLIDIIAGLNDEIRIDLFHGCSVSLFAAVINLPFNTMACLNVGFPPAILLNPQREITLQQINTDGEVLGRMNGQQFRNTLRPTSIQLESGDIVMLYTDGVARCANPKDLNAGRLAIMGSCISNLKHPCLLMINQVLEQTKQIQPGRIADDLTVLAIRVKESV